MRLRFAGLAHISVYRGNGLAPWPVGEERDVPEAVGAKLLEHGGFAKVEPPEPPKPPPKG